MNKKFVLQNIYLHLYKIISLKVLPFTSTQFLYLLISSWAFQAYFCHLWFHARFRIHNPPSFTRNFVSVRCLIKSDCTTDKSNYNAQYNTLFGCHQNLYSMLVPLIRNFNICDLQIFLSTPRIFIIETKNITYKTNIYFFPTIGNF